MAGVGLIEKRRKWILPIDGLEVTRVTVDFAVEIALEDVLIRIEGPFDLSYVKSTVRIDPQDPGASASLPDLHGVRVGAGIARKDGVLTLEFFDSHTITVPPDHRFEAWHVASPSLGFRVAALPGGGLSVS